MPITYTFHQIYKKSKRNLHVVFQITLDLPLISHIFFHSDYASQGPMVAVSIPLTFFKAQLRYSSVRSKGNVKSDR